MFECKISERLTELRTAKGVTQEEVAASLSVSSKTVSKWENGASSPDLAMLVELAKYYDVSTDLLLGVAEDKHQSTREMIRSEIKGLSRRDAILKVFEMVKSIAPAISGAMNGDCSDAYPTDTEQLVRSMFCASDFYEFAANSDNANVAVMLLRNKSGCTWLKDPEKQAEIIRLFSFLADSDALNVLYFINSDSCPERFTADYVSKNTGLTEERVRTILDEFCNIGHYGKTVAHLEEGEVWIYRYLGDGLVMSLLTLAYEQMCGTPLYDYHFGGTCKMIGGR